MDNYRSREWRDFLGLYVCFLIFLSLYMYKLWCIGILDLWWDGLICVYEFIFVLVKNFKVVGDFGN